MKKLSLVIVMIMLLLSGCSSKKDFQRYTKMSQAFNSFSNYRIEENNNGNRSTYDFTSNAIHFVDSENDIYCYFEDDVMYAAAYDSKNQIYVSREEEFDEHYFHPYELSERINKLGGYVNMGELVWKNGEFYGNRFTGSYIYKNELHQPLEIRIEVKDNDIVSLYERYENNGKECMDEILISNHGINSIDLPLNMIDSSFLEELQKIKESPQD